MQEKQEWQTRASTTHVQSWARHVQARKRYAHTKGFVDVRLCQSRLCWGCVCVNMHNEQSKTRAGGLFVDQALSWWAEQGCQTDWHPLRVSLLSDAQFHSRRFSQTCSNASCWALGTVLLGIRRIVDSAVVNAVYTVETLIHTLPSVPPFLVLNCHASVAFSFFFCRHALFFLNLRVFIKE